MRVLCGLDATAAHASLGTLAGMSVVEHDDLPYDAMHRAGPHLIVGETAHLRWRLWLAEVRADARAEAVRIVRAGLADLLPELDRDDAPHHTATTQHRRT